MKFLWYFNRFKSMSVSELPYRFRQLAQNKYENMFCAGQKLTRNLIPPTIKILKIEYPKSKIFPKYISVFGKEWNYSNESINWQKDIFSDKFFRLTFSKKINIRKEPDLSAKNVWEINRLQFLVHVALNYRITRDQKYLDQFIQLTESWIDANPYLLGINWYSNIEVNIRLINWFFCWEILKAHELVLNNKEFKRFVTEKWIPSVYQHCSYSYINPSKYSSANNHLISEYAGLFISASLWKFNESGKWLSYAKSGLEKEIVNQHSNGINKEEAAEYIQFITDFFLLAYIVAEKTNNSFSANYTKTLKEIFEYIYVFTDIKTNFPKYGDEDDGKVVCFSTDAHFNNFKSLLTTASILFQDERFKSKSAGFDLKNELLFGEEGKNIFNNLQAIECDPSSGLFRKEGHFIFRKQENKKEIYLHFDAAPLGYLSIAAHGHADALSFLMNINGFPVFVDPGTYSYHVSKEWRNYFVSTMAHNTICVDGKNQAKQAGDTMWTGHYQCKVLSAIQNEEIESVKASHNGYSEVKHSREITFNKKSDTFTIQDEIGITDGRVHECNIQFHLHPDINITEISANQLLIEHQSGIKITMSIEGFSSLTLIKGQEEPILGWYSGSFLQKEPTTVVCAKIKSNLSFKSVTKIYIHEY